MGYVTSYLKHQVDFKLNLRAAIFQGKLITSKVSLIDSSLVVRPMSELQNDIVPKFGSEEGFNFSKLIRYLCINSWFIDNFRSI